MTIGHRLYLQWIGLLRTRWVIEVNNHHTVP